MDNIEIGMTVRHKTYGAGVVNKIVGPKKERMADVLLDVGGDMRLSVESLEPVEIPVKEGQQVTHGKFGPGVVRKVSEGSSGLVCRVEFEDGDVRKLLAHYLDVVPEVSEKPEPERTEEDPADKTEKIPAETEEIPAETEEAEDDTDTPTDETIDLADYSRGRRCEHCEKPIRDNAHWNQKYCDSTCREGAKRTRDATQDRSPTEKQTPVQLPPPRIGPTPPAPSPLRICALPDCIAETVQGHRHCTRLHMVIHAIWSDFLNALEDDDDGDRLEDVIATLMIVVGEGKDLDGATFRELQSKIFDAWNEVWATHANYRE